MTSWGRRCRCSRYWTPCGCGSPTTDPRRTAIVRLLRGEVTADRGTDSAAVLAEQLLALVAEQCGARPTILIVDDLQWADQASISAVGQAGAGLARQLPLLLIGMMRPVPQRDDLLALRRAVGDDGQAAARRAHRVRGRPSWWPSWPAASPTRTCCGWPVTRRATRCTSPS